MVCAYTKDIKYEQVIALLNAKETYRKNYLESKIQSKRGTYFIDT